jgi:hypothetical protein
MERLNKLQQKVSRRKSSDSTSSPYSQPSQLQPEIGTRPLLPLSVEIPFLGIGLLIINITQCATRRVII